MTTMLTAAQMRAAEAAAIATGQVNALDLMTRAGAGVLEAVLAEWPDLAATTHRAVVLCGPGNNGGDGFVVARLLHDRGWRVDVFFLGERARLSAQAGACFDRWQKRGAVHPLAGAAETIRADPPDLIVDALYGTGLSRPLGAEIVATLSAIGLSAGPRCRLVAVDLPSGVLADTGQGPGALAAGLTVTFHRPKAGHLLAMGPALCGALRVVDIGLGAADPADAVRLARATRVPLAKPAGHKFTHGHALILSGPIGRSGAARLAARGALRIGAGVVTLGCPTPALPECAAQVTALMLCPIDSAADLSHRLADNRITTLCLGPGLGLDRADLVAAALASCRATVLDADALTLLGTDPALLSRLHDRCVLTPHAGEFARLFPDLARQLDDPTVSKVAVTRAAARRAGAVVLFKGQDTVIADPAGSCAVHSAVRDRAAPWLATAGSGDVLAGFITGLLARGWAPMAAAETAASLHVDCARSFGPGLIAEDLPEELPKVLRALGL